MSQADDGGALLAGMGREGIVVRLARMARRSGR